MSQAGGQIAVHGPAVLVTYIHFPNLVWRSVSGASNLVEGGKEDNAFKGGTGSIQLYDTSQISESQLGIQCNQPPSSSFITWGEVKCARSWLRNWSPGRTTGRTAQSTLRSLNGIKKGRAASQCSTRKMEMPSLEKAFHGWHEWKFLMGRLNWKYEPKEFLLF